MEKEIFTAPEIAKICRVSRQTIFYWIKKGYLNAFRPAKNAVWKVTRRELVKYMKEHEIPMEFLYGEKIKILVVDDEVSLTRLIEESFRDIDKFQLETANSGFIAGAKLESFKPDVVILDIFLGDIDGREFFKHIREHTELFGIKVIGISGKFSEIEIQSLLEQGFSDFLQKPFKIEKLKESILKVFGE